MEMEGMKAAELKELGALLIREAKSEIPLSAFAGLAASELAKILQLAVSKMKVGQNDEASRILFGLVAVDGRNALFRQYLANALERLRDYDAALVQHDAAIDELSTHPEARAELCEAHLLRSRLHALRGDVASAKGDLSRGKELDLATNPVISREVAQLEKILGGGAQ